MLNIDNINLLVSCPNTDGGLVQVLKGKAHRVDHSGTTGMHYFQNKLIRSVQHSDFTEFLVYNEDNSYVSIILRELSDIHDLLVFKDLLYVVSTGTNEVVTLDASYKIQKRYKFDGEGDAWHLNCLEVINDRVCVSAFCNFKEHYNYKGKTLNNGFLIDVESEVVLIDKLSQPHSPKFDGEHLYICDSEKKSLKKFDHKNNLIDEITFGSYTRAICIDGNNLYVGLSKSRNIDDNSEEAQILVLDKNTFDILGKILIPCSEIYNIQLLDGQEPFIKKEVLNFYTATTLHELQQELQKSKLENGMLKNIGDIAKLDVAYYLEKNEDIRKAGLDPYEHYYFYGKKESRFPNRYCEHYKLDASEIVSTSEDSYHKTKLLEKNIKELEQQNAQKTQEFQLKAQTIQELQTQKTELQENYTQKLQEVEELSTNLEEIVNDLANVKESNAEQKQELEDKIAQITNSLNETAQTLQETQEAKETLIQDNTQKSNELEQKAKTIQGLQEQKAELEQNLEEIVNDLANVKESNAEQKQELEDKIAQITNSLNETAQTLQETQEAKETLIQDNTQKSNELEQKAKTIQGLQEQKAELEQNLDEIVNDLANVKESNAEQKQELEDKIAQITNSLNETAQKLEALNSEHLALSTEHLTLKEEHLALEQNLDEVVNDLACIKESKCWLYTKPIRDLQKAIKGKSDV